MTKFLCDVHLPIKLCKFLVSQGYEAIHVNQILSKSTTPDHLISQYADQHNFVVITKDADFRNSYFLQKTPRKLIRLCLGNLSNSDLLGLVEMHLPAIERLNETNSFYLEVSREAVIVFD
ncbi:MAG TPA: DUF5615 family PIN-like protein [Fibrella sp.]